MTGPLHCARCGRALDGDRDEDPIGDEGRPICGERARERDFFVMDQSDGVLDGRIDTERHDDAGSGSFDD